MAPLRVPPNPFDRWARSESGLHLPSRLVPRAARRMHHIEKFGQAQCCCAEGEGCQVFSGSTPSTIAVAVSGFVDDDPCECSVLNGNYELDLIVEESDGEDCFAYYEYSEGGIVCWVKFHILGSESARQLSASVATDAPSPPYLPGNAIGARGYSGATVLFPYDGTWEDTDDPYSLGTHNLDADYSLQDCCEALGVSFEVEA